jgi:hypothetical protein
LAKKRNAEIKAERRHALYFGDQEDKEKKKKKKIPGFEDYYDEEVLS